MIADEIISVAIESDPPGAIQALAKVTIKHQITQALAIDQIFQRLRHACSKLGCGGERMLAAVLEDCRAWHA
jgi:hypothetical protein